MPPWERYQTSEPAAAGPWSKYGAPAHEQTADEAMASPEGQQLAKELRNKADMMLLGDKPSAGYAALSSALNTAGLNIPRNVAAYARSFKPDSKGFESEYNYLKAVDDAEARQSPWAAGAGTVGGLVGSVAALPVAPAASLGARMAQGAGIGAATSGVAELADSKNIGSAGLAALGGAALGGVAPPIVEGAAKAIGAAAGGVGRQVRSLINAEGEAGRRVADALRRDAQVGGTQLDEAALANAQAAGQPAVVADMGGETTRGLARSAANTSPEARQALKSVTDARFESQAPRVADFVHNLGSGQDAFTTREALKEAAARANRPAYVKAYAQGANGVWNDALSQLAQAPDVAAAIKQATRTGANKAAAEGFRPVKNPFTVADTGEVSLAGEAVPTLQFWDHVKRNLDDRISSLQRSGENSAARDAIELRSQLVANLDSAAPAYAEARAGAAKFFGAQDALEAGQKFVTAAGKNSEYAASIAKMSAPEKKLFADGFASQLASKVSETGDRRSVLNSIFNSGPARQRVAMALGADKAREFEAFLRVETMMDGLRTAVQGNSTTARQLVEAGLAGGAVGALSADNFSGGAMLGAIARAGKMRIDANVAKRVGEMLASNDPEVFKRAVRMVAKSDSLMDFIKKADVKIGALLSGGGEEVGKRIVTISRGITSGQSPSRADDENTGVIPAMRRQ